eukprot:m.34466 g.34466  ORF g.34466 m.34466 type:complete len:441 (+) comp31984_c0_seq14:808-2130(+)
MSSGRFSIVQYIVRGSDVAGQHCGYCNEGDGQVVNGIWAHTLTCQDYKYLMDRGWARSGKYVYKPRMKTVCCPAYIIRCEALDFSLSKSQKAVLKKMQRYLAGKDKREGEKAAKFQSELKNAGPAVRQLIKVVAKRWLPRPGLGADPDKPRCRKAKEIRREQWLSKRRDAAISSHRSAKKLEDFFETDEDAHKLTVKILPCSMANDEFKASFQETYALYVKYLIGVHGKDESECSRKSFSTFLVDSPLTPCKPEDGPPFGYGSFHQQYRIDGELIAVGVLDIVPNCLCSIYMFYDPDYSFLSIGTYTALREIHFTRQLQKQVPNLTFYYMGYYIRSCQKMKYKGQYQPSFLLCPEAYSWIPIQQCVPKLDASKYSRLDDRDAEEDEVEVSKVLILSGNTAMPYEIFAAREKDRQHEQDVREYAQLIGPKAATGMLLLLEL